jgi:hypothetical protein
MSDTGDTNTSIVQFVDYVSIVLGLIHLFSSCDFVLSKCSVLLLHDVKTCKTKVYIYLQYLCYKLLFKMKRSSIAYKKKF